MRVLVAASTFPADEHDQVPSFVKDQIVAMKNYDSSLDVIVLAPHDTRSNTASYTKQDMYEEYRYHYMWPRRLEILAGQGGIVPNLKKHPWLYLIVPFFLLAQLYATIKICRKLKPDIINAHWIIPQGIICVIAGILTKTKVVSTVHGGDVFTFNNAAFLPLKRFVFSKSSAIVVNSSATLKKSRHIYPRATYELIPMGVHLPSKIDPHKEEEANPLNLLFVGRISEEKGIQDVIASIPRIREKGIDARLTVVGSGPYEAMLRNQLKKIGDVSKYIHFTGWINQAEIAKYYQEADIFIAPSIEASSGWKEALGVVFLEAASYRLPVITTSTGGIVDIIKHNSTGLIVDQHSPSQITDAVVTLQDPSLRHKLGNAAYAHVQKNYSWPSIAKRYVKLIQDTGKES